MGKLINSLIYNTFHIIIVLTLIGASYQLHTILGHVVLGLYIVYCVNDIVMLLIDENVKED